MKTYGLYGMDPLRIQQHSMEALQEKTPAGNQGLFGPQCGAKDVFDVVGREIWHEWRFQWRHLRMIAFPLYLGKL